MRCPGRSPTRSQPAPARSWSAISSEYSWLYSRQHQDSDPILTDPSRTRPCFPVIPNVQPQLRRPGPDPGPSDFDFPENPNPEIRLVPRHPECQTQFRRPGLDPGPSDFDFPETRTPKSALFPVIPNVKPNIVAPGLTRGPATLIFRKPEPRNPPCSPSSRMSNPISTPRA